jgi:hypothetical protein
VPSNFAFNRTVNFSPVSRHPNHFFFACAARLCTHIALAAAAILARAAELMLRPFFATVLAEGAAAFALIAAHLAFCAALIRAMPAALMTLFFRTGLEAASLATGPDFALIAAHLALAAALILAMAEALILRLPAFDAVTGLAMPVSPVIDSSCFCRVSICSLRVAAFRNCAGVKFIQFIGVLKMMFES